MNEAALITLYEDIDHVIDAMAHDVSKIKAITARFPDFIHDIETYKEYLRSPKLFMKRHNCDNTEVL